MKRKFSFIMAIVMAITIGLPAIGDTVYASGSTRHLYVSTRGSDTNDGTLAHPFATIDKAALAATPGTVVHVAPGTYGKVRTLTSGTADARIVYISDVKWGAKIAPDNAWSSWYNDGDYVDIVGFDVTGTGFIGIHSDASYVRIIGNHVHDIANTGDPGGSGGAGIDHTDYAGTGNEILGNLVHDIGPKVENQRIHGIYLSNTHGIIKNNIAYNCSGWGIHLYHACSHDTIESNLVFGNLAGGIIVSNGSAQGVINDYTTVSNNIVMYNRGLPAIIEGNGYTGPNNRYVNNILYGNSNNTIQLYLGTQEGTIYSDPKFVDFQQDGSGDYHFQSDSPAVPQSAYYNADADYGCYEVWNSSADWDTAAHDLGTGNSGEIAAEFDLTILDDSVNGLAGYSGSSSSVGSEVYSEVYLPIIISLDNTEKYFKVRNGDIDEALAQVNYTEDTRYHFKVIPDFTAKTYDVYVTPEGGTETAIAEGYAFQGAQEMDGLAWCSLKSDSDNAFRIENHVLETTALPPDDDDDEEFVITGEKWFSTQAFSAGVHELGQGNTGMVTMAFDFITSDNTQNFGLGYADSSTEINGWAAMAMIITNEFDADLPYFVIRNGGDYACAEQVSIENAKIYHFRIVADLDEKTYSVYVTPEGGSETAIAVNYAFRTGAPQMDSIGQLSLTSDFDGSYAVGDYYVFPWVSTQAFSASVHDLGDGNTGDVTLTFDFMTTDNTQSFGLGYAGSSTEINGWATMAMIITNEFDADLPYFVVRNGGDYACMEQVSIRNGAAYRVRITANLDERTYSVYVTPEGGSETAIAVDYAFRTGAPQMDSIGQLSLTSDFDGTYVIGGHHVFQWVSTQAFSASVHDLGQGNTGNVAMTFDFMTTDNEQSFGLGYADSSTVINGWGTMAMIITNEFDADLPYFVVRSGGDYACMEQVSIRNGETYHIRITANLGAKTYSVYVTPERGKETAIAMDYAFRTGAPQVNSIGQLSLTSDFDGVCFIGNHSPRAGQTQSDTGVYYVSNEGSDSNDGSQEHPFATIDKAASMATPGTVVHVAPGTYGRVITQVDGTEDARIIFVSDTKWGAKIITAGAWQSWFNYGDYVDIIGFEISGDGFIGIRNEGSNVRVIGNNVHNVGNTGDSLGNGGAGILHTDVQQHDNDTIGNVVYDIGPAGEDQSIHGIYHGVNGGHVYNNIVYGCSGWGIHIWQAATDVEVDRNLIFENRAGGIIVGNSKGGTNDNTIVSHNIFMNNDHMPAILEDSSHTGPHNRYINNILYGNEDNSLLLRNGIADEGTIYSDPQFVNFQPDGSGDYHYMSTSPAVPQEAYYDTDFDYEAWLSAGGKYTVVKTKLTDALVLAQAKKDNAVVGTTPLDPGEVLQSDLDALSAAITAAQSVADDEAATIAEVNDAVTMVNNAINTFDSAAEPVETSVIIINGYKDEYILNEYAIIDWIVDDGNGAGADGQAAGTLVPDTSTVGIHSVTITAADLAGNPVSKEIIYCVKYVYSNLLRPIDSSGSNVFKQGRTIPLKLWLKDADGIFISNAEVKLYIAKIVDGAAGTESDIVPSTGGSSGNAFRYDSTDEQYIFNFSTKSLSPGLYQLRVELGDTTINTIDIFIE